MLVWIVMVVLAAVVSGDRWTTACHSCFRETPAICGCERCPSARYCSPLCKENAADTHNIECRALSQLTCT